MPILLGHHMTGGACETNAGVFTSMLRRRWGSPPDRLIWITTKPPGHGEFGNFDGYEYDHAVMMWVRGPGDAANRWYADRTSVTGEAEYQTMDSPRLGRGNDWNASPRRGRHL